MKEKGVLRTVRLCALGLCIAALVAPALGVDTYWQHDPNAAGDWFVPGNWSAGVPRSWDKAYVDNGGTAVISGGTSQTNVFAGYDNAGTVRQTGGMVSPLWHIQIAQNAGSTGSYQFDGGIISTGNIYVGWFGQGQFTQDGGEVQSLNMLSLARDTGSTGTYALKSGSIDARLVKIGHHSIGVFVHTGGSFNSPDRFYVGMDSDGDGSYMLKGTGILTTVKASVGTQGPGRFVQSGGTHRISDELILGRDSGASGTYAVSGGLLAANLLTVGSSGEGEFEVSGVGATVTLGSYAQGATGRLVSKIASGGISPIVVTGGAQLDGTWTVTGLMGATFGRFDVLKAAGGLTGSFDAASLPGPDRNWSWGVEDETTLWVEHAPLEARMDVRPDCDENPVNLASRGVLPVGIYGSEEFDVSQIDLNSLSLEGAGPRQKGNSGNVGSLTDIDGDSFLDLLLQFNMNELSVESDVEELSLLGRLGDGTVFKGMDSIRIVPPGDADGSGTVDGDDLSLLLANWGPGAQWEQGNFNSDNTVNEDDLSLLLANWNQGTPSMDGSAVPEPTTLLLLAVGACLPLIRRRR